MKKVGVCVLFVIFAILASAEGAEKKKHVSFVSLGMRGHIYPMLPIAEELMNRGHHVSFLLPEELLGWVRKELNDNARLEVISTGPTTISADKVHTVFRDYSNNVQTFDSPLSAAWAFSDRSLFAGLFLEESIILFREGVKHFGSVDKQFLPDVFVVDPFTSTGFDLARHFEKEWIIFHPGLICFLEHYVGRNQPWIPRSNSGFPVDMSLFQRLINPLVSPLILANILPFLSELNSPRTALGITVPGHPFDDFEGKLIISGSAPPLQVARELPDTVKMVGPVIFDRPLNAPLEPKLAKFLKEADDQPIVLFSFGTLVVPTAQQIKSIVAALEYKRVIWTMSKKNQEETKFNELILGSDFFVTEWVPQQQLLAHPNVKLFISHCGANSVHEAMWFGKPVICVPYFADQFDFARRVEEAGAGIYVDKFSIDTKSLASSVNKLLQDQSFEENAQKIRGIFRSMNGPKKAADAIEIQLSSGIAHLIPPSSRPLHELIATVVFYASVAVTLFGVFFVASTIVRCFLNPSSPKAKHD